MAMLVLLAVTISEGYAASVGGGFAADGGQGIRMYLPDKSLKQDYSVTAIPPQIALMPSRRRRRKAALATQRKDQPLKVVSRARCRSLIRRICLRRSWKLLPDGGQVRRFRSPSLARACRRRCDLEGFTRRDGNTLFGSKNSETSDPSRPDPSVPSRRWEIRGYRIGAGSVLVAGDRGETASGGDISASFG